jgi:hypothetical protein
VTYWPKVRRMGARLMETLKGSHEIGEWAELKREGRTHIGLDPICESL